ncbi:hypothetical protein CH370_09705 [Leptospira kmetyi]|uniref:DUF4238 domain-containing protein n=1 Tax=Leptospira kmetyi TaxID=408139 RepID=UPI000C29F93D|nr:DUF4238 domain-containing protein [Leptospira kmetyi]PJZ41702.1 hypothetical protein CH370_09705 [Leptospira kmetyi]
MSQRHHFVPKILINGFLDPASVDELGRNPFTWIYEKEKKASKKKSPDNILWERNLYTQYDGSNNEDHSLEQFFSQKLEYPFAQFKKDHENNLLSMNRSVLEKSNLGHLRMFFVAFIFWHWKRSYKFISRVKESYKQELLKDHGAEILVDYIDSKAMQNDILYIL